MNKITENADSINCNDKPKFSDMECIDVPKQTSGSECGIFICQYMSDFFENPANINFKMPQIQDIKNTISEWVNESINQNTFLKQPDPKITNMLNNLKLHQVH